MMETGRDVIEKEEELAATFNSLLELPIPLLPHLSLNESNISDHNSTQSFNSSLIDSIISIHNSNDTNNDNNSSISSNEVFSINTTLFNSSFYHDLN